MSSGVNPGNLPIAGVVQGRETASTVSVPESGKSVPPGGKIAAPAANKSRSTGGNSDTDPQSLVDLLNKNLNDSGRPDQFRVDPGSNDKIIQQINPANGEVIGQFPVSEFPALARSIGASGLLFDSLA